jgi:V8-like Glu-specific endopeptidase
LAAALALGLCGCGGADGVEPVETYEDPIVDGEIDTGDPAVVELLAVRTNSLSKCTATLVSPRVLLTAAHCIADAQGATFRVYLGNDDSKIDRTKLLNVSAAVFDPAYGDPTQGHDIGVVVLGAPLSITPIPINRAPLSGVVGKVARYVGYGLTNGITQTGSGIKRQGSAPIAEISRVLIAIGEHPHLTCSGDSGGPLFLTMNGVESIIGVTSFGDKDCQRAAYFQRMDTQMAWVDQQLKKYDPAGAPDGGAPAPSDAAPPVADSGLSPWQKLPEILVDAQPSPPVEPPRSGTDSGTTPPKGGTGGTPDAGSGMVPPDEAPALPSTTSGCTYTPGPLAEGGASGVGLGVFAVAFGAVARRRRVRHGPRG